MKKIKKAILVVVLFFTCSSLSKINACCTGGPDISLSNVTVSYAIGMDLLDPFITEGPGICIFISGTLTVDVDYIFTNVEFRLDTDAVISVESANKLTIISSNIEGCNDLWGEITVKENATLSIRDSRISDGYRAINVHDNCKFSLIGVTFDDNRTAIYSNAQQISKHQIEGCSFLNTSGISTYGILLNGLSYFNIGYPVYNNYAPVTPLNIFDGVEHGIYLIQSNISVHGCQFLNNKWAIAYFGNCSIIQTGLGAPPPNTPGSYNVTPSFQDVQWCFYSASEDFTRSEYNLIKDVEVGYYNDGANPVTQIEITKNNILDSRWSGIIIDGSPGSVLIEDNYIETENNQDNLPSHGIYFRLQNPPISPSFIQNNEIRSFSDDGNGILLNGYGPNVINNNIGMLSTSPSQFPNTTAGIGIYHHLDPGVPLEGSSIIECNHIEGESVIKDIHGIYCASTSSILFSCNEIENIKNGATFTGVCTNTDFRGNSFKNHDLGLFLDESIMGFGIQEHKGNTWSGTYTSNEARYEGVLANLPAYRFKVNPSDGSNLLPINPFPATNWFVTEPGDTYQCPNTCDAGIEWGLTDTDTEVATGVLDASIYNPEQQWLAAKRLYRKVQVHDLLGLDSKIDSFYNANTNTSIGRFVSIENSIRDAMTPDSSIQIQIKTNRDKIIFLMDTLAMIEKALTTATGQDSVDLINESLSFMGQLHNLAPLQDSIINIVDTTRNNDLDGIITLNAGVTTTTTQENNIKTYNDIKLNHFYRGDYDLSPSQEADVYNIANQCPYSGGDLVYGARAAYMSLLDTFIYFNDSILCSQSQQSSFISNNNGDILEEQLNSVNIAETNSLNEYSLFPNPASQSVNLLINHYQFRKGRMMLFDVLGKKVVNISLSAGQQKYTINTSFLPNGIYLCKIWIDGKETFIDKLSINSN